MSCRCNLSDSKVVSNLEGPASESISKLGYWACNKIKSLGGTLSGGCLKLLEIEAIQSKVGRFRGSTGSPP